MKAAIVTGPGVAPIYGDFDHSEPQSGEQRVRVSAAALSHLTRGRASGSHYSADNQFPFVPGVDGVGRLDDGSRVYFAIPRMPFGGMAEQTFVDPSHCVPVPDDLDDVTAAALANPGMSSWAALRHRARLHPGETVLINGATGVSGRLAVAIARHLGAGRIIATGRNLATLESLKDFGADATIPLTGGETESDLRKHFSDGVDVVLDYLWGESARSILLAGAKFGPDGRAIRFVQIGSMAGGDIALPAAALRSSAIELMGSGIGSVSLPNLLGSIGEMLAAARTAGLAITTQAVPLSDVEKAWSKDDRDGRIVFTFPHPEY